MLSVEKQLAMTLYYLKDQGSIVMTANAFRVALCTVSIIVHKVCHVLTKSVDHMLSNCQPQNKR